MTTSETSSFLVGFWFRMSPNISNAIRASGSVSHLISFLSSRCRSSLTRKCLCRVYADKKPVTGLRLYLEGKSSNCLAIRLQHLSSLPMTFQLEDRVSASVSDPSSERKYYEKIQWKNFFHAYTAPVESDEDVSIVTGAHFEVRDHGLKKVLFLRLHFSKLIGAKAIKHPEWDGSPGLAQKSGIISTLISTHFTGAQKQAPQPTEVNINSALYPKGPPVPSQAPKLLRFVDTTEMSRGQQDLPGY